MITVSSRGSKKDFIDIFFILQQYELADLFGKLKDKFTGIDYNEAHLLKSLVYFVDADKQPGPRMLKEVDWEEVKQILVEKVKQFQI